MDSHEKSISTNKKDMNSNLSINRLRIILNHKENMSIEHENLYSNDDYLIEAYENLNKAFNDVILAEAKSLVGSQQVYKQHL